MVCERFEKDQHNILIRHFFRVKQTESVVDYIERFDTLVHQILAYDPKFSTVTITNRFIDGLKDEIQAMVLVHNPQIWMLPVHWLYCRKKPLKMPLTMLRKIIRNQSTAPSSILIGL
jgi:hypothetical protein